MCKYCKSTQRFLFEIEWNFQGPTTKALHKGPRKPCYATGAEAYDFDTKYK